MNSLTAFANQTMDLASITAECARFLNRRNPAITWKELYAEATAIFSALPEDFPKTEPTGPLTPRSLAMFVKEVTFFIPDTEPVDADDIHDEQQEERPRQRRRHEEEDEEEEQDEEDEEEEEDSFVVSDDFVEYMSSDSDSD